MGKPGVGSKRHDGQTLISVCPSCRTILNLPLSQPSPILGKGLVLSNSQSPSLIGEGLFTDVHEVANAQFRVGLKGHDGQSLIISENQAIHREIKVVCLLFFSPFIRAYIFDRILTLACIIHEFFNYLTPNPSPNREGRSIYSKPKSFSRLGEGFRVRVLKFMNYIRSLKRRRL